MVEDDVHVDAKRSRIGPLRHSIVEFLQVPLLHKVIY